MQSTGCISFGLHQKMESSSVQLFVWIWHLFSARAFLLVIVLRMCMLFWLASHTSDYSPFPATGHRTGKVILRCIETPTEGDWAHKELSPAATFVVSIPKEILLTQWIEHAGQLGFWNLLALVQLVVERGSASHLLWILTWYVLPQCPLRLQVPLPRPICLVRNLVQLCLSFWESYLAKKRPLTAGAISKPPRRLLQSLFLTLLCPLLRSLFYKERTVPFSVKKIWHTMLSNLPNHSLISLLYRNSSFKGSSPLSRSQNDFMVFISMYFPPQGKRTFVPFWIWISLGDNCKCKTSVCFPTQGRFSGLYGHQGCSNLSGISLLSVLCSGSAKLPVCCSSFDLSTAPRMFTRWWRLFWICSAPREFSLLDI